MKKLLVRTCIVSSIVMVTVVPIHGATSDGLDRQDKLFARASSYDFAMRRGVCWGGWWQTLYYGHVRPRWGVQCVRTPVRLRG